MKKRKGTGLKYIRITDCRLIPRGLLNQADPDMFPVEGFYKYADAIFKSPLNYLGVFVTPETEVKGVLWYAVEPLTPAIFCQLVLVDADYRGRGFLKEAFGIMRKTGKNIGVERITGLSKTPEIYKSCGLKQTDKIYMEF